MSGFLLRRIFQAPGRLTKAPALKQTSLVAYNVSSTTSTGAVLPKPKLAYSLGILRVLVVSTPFIYAGAMAAKFMASSLEEFDLFVPDDDDD